MQRALLLLLSVLVAFSAGAHHSYFGEYEKIWSQEKIFKPQESESFHLVPTDSHPILISRPMPWQDRACVMKMRFNRLLSVRGLHA